jgi:predicted DNA-binding protein
MMSPMSRKKKYTFFITDELDEALKALKERDGIAEAEAVRRALTAYLAEKGVLEKRDTQAASRRGGTRRKA